MIPETMLELSLLLSITEKLPYDKKEVKFFFQDKQYSGDQIIARTHKLVEEFLKDYEESYVIDSAEKSE